MLASVRGEPPGRSGRSRPCLNADHTAALRAITQEPPRSPLGEATRGLFWRAGGGPGVALVADLFGRN